MKIKLFIVWILFHVSKLNGQTVICQGFEGTAGTWSYTAVGNINTEHARTGINSLRLGRGNGGAGCAVGTDGTVVTFDPVTLIGANCTGIFSFYHRTQTIGGIAASLGCAGTGEGMDVGDGFAVYGKFNNGPWTLLDSWSGSSNAVWTWATAANNTGTPCGSINPFPNPYTYVVPPGTNVAEFKILTFSQSNCANFLAAVTAQTSNVYNRGDEGFFIDAVCFQTFAPCTLPISLSDLTANYFDSKVVLHWTTTLEVNNDHFTIERSKDGISFEAVGKIKGVGSTLKKQKYSFTDNDPYLDDVSYYRLKQTDQNGNYAYSKIVSIDPNLEQDLNVYPNPSQDGVFFIITDYFSSTSNFYEVLDYSGRKIIEQKIQGNKSVLDLTGNGKGLYILRSTINGKTSSKKVVFN